MLPKILMNLLFIFPLIVLGQSSVEGDIYDVKNYREVRRGHVDGYDNVILYVHKTDTNYTYKEIHFLDSTYTEGSFMRTFYFRDIPNGPFTGFIVGQISQKGTYKDGRRHGEIVRFKEGKIESRSYFDNGIKTGKWEDYDESGKLIRIAIFDKDILIKSENF